MKSKGVKVKRNPDKGFISRGVPLRLSSCGGTEPIDTSPNKMLKSNPRVDSKQVSSK